MEKVKSYAGVIVLGVVATLIGLKVYEMINKPKTAVPATAAATTGAGAAAE